ncbi:MAG: hypothetical protein ABIA93_02725 [Candidatus Woesearchaeota archaeon]
MFIDICFPSGNEEEFLKTAKALGTGKLLFVYKEMPSHSKGIKAALFNTKAARQKPSLVLASGARNVFEHPSVNLVYGQEKLGVKDTVRQPDSGMNEVLARILARKDKAYGIAISDLIENPALIRRFKQNIIICQKAKTPIVLASFAKKPEQMRKASDLEALGSYIGIAQPKKATEALSNFLLKHGSE